MTVVVGLPRGQRASAALHLAALLARSSGDSLVVCAVAPAAWPPGPARVDEEYQQYVEKTNREALESAGLVLPSDLDIILESTRARSVPAGLLETAAKHRARVLVLGSTSVGRVGRVSLGGVADQVLHSAPVPVALTPYGFRAEPDTTVRRITASYGATSGADQFAIAAAELAIELNAALRLASFAVRPGPVVSAGVGLHAEDTVVGEWRDHIEQLHHRALTRLASRPAVPRSVDTAVGFGADWREAVADIGWSTGDLLAVGSSSVGPLSRVFLGSRASKIVRNSPAPVLVLPRGAVDDLTDRADQPPA
ncbi:universal stress protein [Fodinicola acaciae]|uniref:universal stress protein n=1 Tax=Fodinicola acaciae TaxID=2681555 RepID=UPI0013D2875F|nr:universal stress protein [Fodinicola acaciae]